MVFTLINHLDNYARPLKCLNDQGGNSRCDDNGKDILTFPISFIKYYNLFALPDVYHVTNNIWVINKSTNNVLLTNCEMSAKFLNEVPAPKGSYSWIGIGI